MNNRRYVKIMVNVGETDKFCHKFCEFNSTGGYCSLFHRNFISADLDYKFTGATFNEFENHIRLPECIEHQI